MKKRESLQVFLIKLNEKQMKSLEKGRGKMLFHTKVGWELKA